VCSRLRVNYIPAEAGVQAGRASANAGGGPRLNCAARPNCNISDPQIEYSTERAMQASSGGRAG